MCRNSKLHLILTVVILSVLAMLSPTTVLAASFTAFESGQVRPLALSPDGNRLFVVNTPDNTLEIFDVNNGTPTHAASVAVGMEPVAVAAYSNNQVWVVNYLSDSISIIDVSTFVEILNNKGELVFKALQDTPIKGRLRKVSKAYT